MKSLRERFYSAKKNLWDSAAYKKFEECSRDYMVASKKFERSYKDYINSEIYKAYKASYEESSSSSDLAKKLKFQDMRIALITSDTRKIYDAATKEWDIANKKFKEAYAEYEENYLYKEFIDARKDLIVQGAYQEYNHAYKVFKESDQDSEDIEEFERTSQVTWNTILLMEKNTGTMNPYTSLKPMPPYQRTLANPQKEPTCHQI